MLSHLTDLPKLRDLQSRCITPENPTGGKGMGATEGGGWKGAPFIRPFNKDTTVTIAEIDDPGTIRHIWFALGTERGAAADYEACRNVILRCYWDGQKHPSVECPVGDFFGIAHGRRRAFTSALMTNTNGAAMNSYLPMPFKTARITIENDTGYQTDLAYFIDYTLGDDVSDSGRLHALFKRENPVTAGADYAILPKVEGRGVYIGTILGVRALDHDDHIDTWWGEGEVKMYIDGDDRHPTIVGSGTEDYFCSASGIEPHATPYSGAPYCHGRLFSCYRWHVADPVYFQTDLRVEVQHMGNDMRLIHDPRKRYIERIDDCASVAFWYQDLPSQPLPELIGRRERTVDLELQIGEVALLSSNWETVS